MSEGTTRGEAAAHILAREMGRRARAIQARIDDVERARAEALAEVQSRLIAHDGVDERHAGLIDGLRADLGETHRTTLDAVAIGDAEVRQLTEAQASLIDRIAQRVTQAEDDNARQDADVEVLTTRVDAVEAKAAVPGPKGEKGDKGDRGPRGPMGPAGFSGAGSGTSGGGGAGTVTSVTAGTGITVGGTSTDPVITNSGVTSIVAGTNVTVSGATGAVTVNAPAFATPGSSAFGDTAAAGTATTVSRSDHVHGREAAGTPGASAVGDTAAAGTATTLARSDHRHSREAFGTTITASTIGGTAAAGTSTSVAREDHKHAFPAGAAPSALTVSSTQATGTSTAPALADHVHAMPGSGTPGASAVGDTASAGSATTVALSDHRHSREAFATPGASAVGDTAAAGTATTLARSDHVHGREAFGTPVVVNGQTTALATGSLTTLARADHVHTVSNVPVLLASTTLSSAAASVTFSSIAQTYSTLLLITRARSSYVGANDYVAITYNSDTIWSNSLYVNDNTTGSYADGGAIHGTTNWAATRNALCLTFIAGYATSDWKMSTKQGGYSTSTTAASTVGGVGAPSWYMSTTAISSIKLQTTTGSNFQSNSTFQLYGYP